MLNQLGNLKFQNKNIKSQKNKQMIRKKAKKNSKLIIKNNIKNCNNSQSNWHK